MEAHIIQPGGPRDVRSIPLATKQGRFIPNERRPERAPDALQAAVNLMRLERPDARLRSISATYNCVGLVFANRRTLVDTDDVPMILHEDGYYQVPRLDQVSAGDVVVYRNAIGEIVHVGVVLCKEPEVRTATWKVTILSQWGANGEYIHAPDYVPQALGQPSGYWSERRVLP